MTTHDDSWGLHMLASMTEAPTVDNTGSYNFIVKYILHHIYNHPVKVIVVSTHMRHLHALKDALHKKCPKKVMDLIDETTTESAKKNAEEKFVSIPGGRIIFIQRGYNHITFKGQVLIIEPECLGAI
jgi:hypothetical protein